MCSLVCFWRAVRPMKVMVQRLWILFWAIVAFTVISYGVGMVIFPLLRSHGPNTFSGQCNRSAAGRRENAALQYTTIVDIISDIFIASFPVALFLKTQLVLRQILANCAVFGLGLCTVAVAVVRYIMFRVSCNRPQLLLSSTLFWTINECSLAVVFCSTLALTRLWREFRYRKEQSRISGGFPSGEVSGWGWQAGDGSRQQFHSRWLGFDKPKNGDLQGKQDRRSHTTIMRTREVSVAIDDEPYDADPWVIPWSG
ncbi:hypothetical protein AWENTII_003188 [Aspergillus wentii]